MRTEVSFLCSFIPMCMHLFFQKNISEDEEASGILQATDTQPWARLTQCLQSSGSRARGAGLHRNGQVVLSAGQTTNRSGASG